MPERIHATLIRPIAPVLIDRKQQRASIAKSIRLLKEAGALTALVPTPGMPQNPPKRFSLEQWQTPIQDQGNRGTCWAFASAAALEAAYRRHLGHAIKVSEEYIYHVNRTVRIENDRVEYPCSLWNGQGNSTVLSSLKDDAIPSQDQCHPYVSTTVAIEAIPTQLGTSNNVLTISQKDADDFEFSDLHIPLLARVNARYRVKEWGEVTPLSIDSIKATLLAGFEVVADIPGHCFLIIGYDDDTQTFLVKDSGGGAVPISVPYQGNAQYAIQQATFIKSVMDPTYVQPHAMWLGKWYGVINGVEHEFVIRRHHAFGKPGEQCALGASWSARGHAGLSGTVSADGLSADIVIGVSEQGAAGEHLKLRIHNRDPYLIQGQTAAGVHVEMDRFRQRYAAVWTNNDGHDWQGYHGMPSRDHQALFDRLTAQGYRAINVQGAPIGSTSAMCSVWSKSPIVGWRAFHGQSNEDYQRTFDQCCAEGWRLVDISGYSESGEPRYASLWEPADGRAWKARHGMNAGDFQVAFDEAVGQGFVIRKVSGYRVGIERLFVAIWEHAPGEHCLVRHGITREELDQLTRLHAMNGIHLSWLSGYPDTGRARFTAVWSTLAPASQYVADLNGVDYQAAFDRLSQAGLRTNCISSYGAGI